jgi:hypothetical protein
MILSIVSFLLNLFSVLFVVYKSFNHIAVSQKVALGREHTSYLITSWVLFLGFSSLKCCCAGVLGSLWNLLVSGGLVFALLKTKTFNKKLFEENTFETVVAHVRGLVENYLPKKKAE